MGGRRHQGKFFEDSPNHARYDFLRYGPPEDAPKLRDRYKKLILRTLILGRRRLRIVDGLAMKLP